MESLNFNGMLRERWASNQRSSSKAHSGHNLNMDNAGNDKMQQLALKPQLNYDNQMMKSEEVKQEMEFDQGIVELRVNSNTVTQSNRSEDAVDIDESFELIDKVEKVQLT